MCSSRPGCLAISLQNPHFSRSNHGSSAAAAVRVRAVRVRRIRLRFISLNLFYLIEMACGEVVNTVAECSPPFSWPWEDSLIRSGKMSELYDQLLEAAIQHLEQLQPRGTRFVSVSQQTLKVLAETIR